jgi:hypothetical protein
MSVCRSCGAEIVFAETERGKIMPIDKEPVANGNLGLFHRVDKNGEPQPHVRSLSTEPQLFGDGPRYQSHFVSCPAAEKHRKAR